MRKRYFKQIKIYSPLFIIVILAVSTLLIGITLPQTKSYLRSYGKTPITTDLERPLNLQIADRAGVGFGPDGTIDINQYPWEQLNVGWYFDWTFTGPASGPKVKNDKQLVYYGLAGGYQKGGPNCSSVRQAIIERDYQTINNMRWTIGNEIGFDDGRTAVEYAQDFIAWRDCLKSINPTYSVGSGAIISFYHKLPGPGCVSDINNPISGKSYFTNYINEIKRLDASKIPDFIVNHAYVNYCKSGNWVNNFKEEIRNQRQTMKDLGLQNKELIINEIGIELLSPSIEQTKQYMTQTITFLLNTTDRNTGHPQDNYRLVQRFAWYKMNYSRSRPFSQEELTVLAGLNNRFNLSELGIHYKSLLTRPINE